MSPPPPHGVLHRKEEAAGLLLYLPWFLGGSRRCCQRQLWNPTPPLCELLDERLFWALSGVCSPMVSIFVFVLLPLSQPLTWALLVSPLVLQGAVLA